MTRYYIMPCKPGVISIIRNVGCKWLIRNDKNVLAMVTTTWLLCVTSVSTELHDSCNVHH